jgi:hypothetical protein
LWKHVGVGHIPKESARRTGAALLTFDKKLAALAQRLDIAVAG